MKLIDERVLAVLTSAPGAMRDNDIGVSVNRRWPPGVSNDSLFASLRRMKIGGQIERIGRSHWNLPGRAFGTELPVEPPDEPEQYGPGSEAFERDDESPELDDDDELPAPDPLQNTPLPDRVPQFHPPAEQESSLKKKCPKCQGTDFTPGGLCRGCKKAQNDAYHRNHPPKAAKPKVNAMLRLTKPDLTPVHDPSKLGDAIKAMNGAATKADATRGLNARGPKMIQSVFMIQVKDSAGDLHDLFFTGETMKQLAHELQEFL